MNIAIVDDLQSECNLLKKYIQCYSNDYHVSIETTVFDCGELFLESFIPYTYELIFLDVYMNGIDGIETAEKIRELDKNCLIVFSTTSQFHAVKGFRVRAFDYLVKPYTYESFLETMRNCDDALFKQSRYIRIKEGRTFIKVLVRDIVFTDYSNHYIYLHTKGRVIKCYMPFKNFSELLLPYSQFINCYRNCIVNMDEVDILDEKDFIMSSGDRVPIGRNIRTQIRQTYANYAFDKLNEGS